MEFTEVEWGAIIILVLLVLSLINKLAKHLSKSIDYYAKVIEVLGPYTLFGRLVRKARQATKEKDYGKQILYSLILFGMCVGVPTLLFLGLSNLSPTDEVQKPRQDEISELIYYVNDDAFVKYEAVVHVSKKMDVSPAPYLFRGMVGYVYPGEDIVTIGYCVKNSYVQIEYNGGVAYIDSFYLIEKIEREDWCKQ